MNKQTMRTFCSLFYKSTSIPIHLFEGGQLVLQLPDSPLDFIGNHLQQLRGGGPEFSCLTAGDAFYARVSSKIKAISAVIGPVMSVRCNQPMLNSIIRASSLPPGQAGAVSDYLDRIPVMPFERFVRQVDFVYFGLNGCEIDAVHLLGIDRQEEETAVAAAYSQEVYSVKEESFLHNSYRFEQEMLKCVEDGNIESLKSVINRPEIYNVGNIADNSLRQTKNIFITTTTLVTRSAIRGGFDIESAYSLSDVYIREAEKQTTIEAVYRLSGTMIYDFTRQVARNKYARGLSPDVSRCMQYIQQSTNLPVSAADVARHIGRSRTYISKKFKSELGFDLSSYIMRCKLEEARSLLAYTDKPIGEISSYLCFSSQSHFQNVFKQKYGLTPGAYRRKSL